MNIEEKLDELTSDIAQVSKIAAEIGKAKADLRARRWRLVAIILAALLIASNIAWAWYASQFEKVIETTETWTTIEDVVADADDGSSINIAGGDITNGGQG